MNNNGGRSVEEMLAYRYAIYDLLRRIFLWQFPLELFTDLATASRGEQSGEETRCSPEAPFKAYLSTVRTEFVEEEHREIHIEYTRLFVGPHHLPAPPYESVYRNPERLLMQDETIDVRFFYAKNGFRVTRIGQEPDDTVGIELEFMCAMSKASMDALSAKDQVKFLDLISTQHEFLQMHLLKWVPSFCRDIAENSTNNFWKSVAEFTQRFLEEDAAGLGALQNELTHSGGLSAARANRSVP